MQSKHPPELVAKIKKMLEHNLDATRFILAYGELTEIADDLVDEPADKKSPTLICKFAALAANIYSSNYWHTYREQLLMVELLNNLTYFDTVIWEHSDIKWKREHARALNHCAYNMLFAVLIIECGIENTKLISEEFRTSAHLHHLFDSTEIPK